MTPDCLSTRAEPHVYHLDGLTKACSSATCDGKSSILPMAGASAQWRLHVGIFHMGRLTKQLKLA